MGINHRKRYRYAMSARTFFYDKKERQKILYEAAQEVLKSHPEFIPLLPNLRHHRDPKGFFAIVMSCLKKSGICLQNTCTNRLRIYIWFKRDQLLLRKLETWNVKNSSPTKGSYSINENDQMKEKSDDDIESSIDNTGEESYSDIQRALAEENNNINDDNISNSFHPSVERQNKSPKKKTTPIAIKSSSTKTVQTTIPTYFDVELKYKEWTVLKPSKPQPHSGSRLVANTRQGLRKGWSNIIFEKCATIIPCVLVAKYNHIKKSDSRKIHKPYWTAKAICKFTSQSNKCCTYNFCIKSKPINKVPVIIQVTRKGLFSHPKGEGHSRPLSGTIREKTKVKLMNKGITRLYDFNVLKASKNWEFGNYSEIPSRDVLRKALSEKRNEARYDRDVIHDIIITKEVLEQTDIGPSSPMKGFIQDISVWPFRVILSSSYQMLLLREQQHPKILYFDSTGKICRRVHDKLNILYYVLLMPHPKKGEPPVPIAEMLSDSNTTLDIMYFLSKVISMYHAVTGEALKLDHIVIDNSLAMIHATVKSFCSRNVPQYVNDIWQDSISAITRVHICCSHFLKEIFSSIAKIRIGVKERSIYKSLIGKLINSKTKGEFVAFLEILIALSISVFYNPEWKTAFQKLKKLPDTDFNISNAEKFPYGDATVEEDQFVKTKTLPGSFFCDVVGRKKKKIKMLEKHMSVHSASVKNRFHAPGLVKVLLSNYLPIVPLWSLNNQRFSNALVESWNNILKNRVLVNYQQDAGTLIRCLSKNIFARCKAYVIQSSIIPAKRKRGVEKRRTLDILSVKEKWKGVKRKQMTNFDEEKIKENIHQITFSQAELSAQKSSDSSGILTTDDDDNADDGDDDEENEMVDDPNAVTDSRICSEDDDEEEDEMVGDLSALTNIRKSSDDDEEDEMVGDPSALTNTRISSDDDEKEDDMIGDPSAVTNIRMSSNNTLSKRKIWVQIENYKLNEEHKEEILSQQWFGDNVIDFCLWLLIRQFPEVRFNSTCLGLVTSGTVQPLQTTNERMIMIINTTFRSHGNHWITLSNLNIGSEELHHINVYDSLYTELTTDTKDFLAYLFFKNSQPQKEDRVMAHMKDVQKQMDLISCGPLAVAFAYHLAIGDDPSSMVFEITHLRSHIAQCIELGKFKPFPSRKRLEPKQSSFNHPSSLGVFHTISVICICRTAFVAVAESKKCDLYKCPQCQVTFHLDCISKDEKKTIIQCPQCDKV